MGCVVQYKGKKPQSTLNCHR